MKAAPRDDAERVSQALYGEAVDVLESCGMFRRVATPDGYEGWVVADALAPVRGLGGDEVDRRMVVSLIEPIYASAGRGARQVTLLTAGVSIILDTRLGGERGLVPIVGPDGGGMWIRRAALGHVPESRGRLAASDVRRFALPFVGVPYLWGGRTPFGIDCSGFSQRVYALCGVTLPRDAYQQAAWAGARVLGDETMRAGDLVFFAGDKDPLERGITHVGVVLEPPHFVHASGNAGVAVSSLDADPYRRQLRCATRLRETGD